MIDVCNNFGIANDLLFNPLESICVVYIPKCYQLCYPSVNIGAEPWESVNEIFGFYFL